jgi:PAS domain S-box-containing protein
MHMNMTPPMVPSIPTSAQSPSNTDWFSTFLQVGHHTDPHAMQPTEGVHSVDEAWARMTGSVPVRVDNLRREASYLRHRVEPENPALSLPIPHDEMLNSPLGVAIWCLWGFLYVNDSWARFLGYTKEELLSGLVFWPQLFPTREMLVRRTGCLAFAFSGDEVHIENPAQFVRKDGSEITCVFTVRAVRDQVGQPVYFVGQLVPLDASMLPSTQHVPRTNTSLLGVLQQQAQAGNNNCAPMMPSMYAYPLQQHQQSQQRQLQHQAQLQMATPTTTYPDAFYLNAPTPDL